MNSPTPVANNHERDQYIARIAEFIEASPTAWHAAYEVADRLEVDGYKRRDETDEWPTLSGGDRGFIVRDGAIIAWHAGDQVQASSPVRIIGAHSDSPGFVVKPGEVIHTEGWAQVGVEIYGGPLLNSWLDRDLAISGRVVDALGHEHLVHTAPVARIPQLAIHLDRGVNEGLTLDKQRNTQPIIGLEGADFTALIENASGIKSSQILGSELRLVETQSPARLGTKGELFAAARLDNLSSVYAGLEALLTEQPAPHEIVVLAVFDHEEVGSETRAGAGGPILSDTVERLLTTLGATPEDFARSRAASWVLSADAGHSVHPNYSEKHDPNVHPKAGQGPMLKINAKQRYASDAHGEALWNRVCETANIPTQAFVSNNTVPCGSTIGPITAARTGIRTVDVGVPLLSMHSARELAHVDDLWHLRQACAAFFRGA